MALNNYSVFLNQHGVVRTCGANSYGQCATGNNNTPQLTLYNPGLDNIKQIACGTSHTAFLLNDGTVRMCGSNTSGQCGTGTTVTPQLSLYTPDFNILLSPIKYLIKQNNQYFTVLSQYYEQAAKTFLALDLQGGSQPTINDINTYGFDNISVLTNDLTINDEIFKPIDKLYSSFDIKKYVV